MVHAKYIIKSLLEKRLTEVISTGEFTKFVPIFLSDDLLRWLDQFINWNTLECKLLKTELLYQLSNYVKHYQDNQIFLSQHLEMFDPIIDAILASLADVFEKQDTTLQYKN